MQTLSVIIAAHGSSFHPGGEIVAEACRQHLERTTHIGGALLCAFWKGDRLPLRDAIAQCPKGHVLILPLLMNDGYFGETVFPREFEVPVSTRAWTQKNGHHVRLTPPAGLDPRFDQLVQTTVLRHLAKPDERLILVSHGTERDPRSKRRAYELKQNVDRLHGEYANRLSVAFLDEDPRLMDALQQEHVGGTTVLPWFSADGAHAGVDIPDTLKAWGKPATQLPSIGAQLFPIICEHRVHDVIQERPEDHGFS